MSQVYEYPMKEHAEAVAVCVGMLAECFNREASIATIQAYQVGLAGLSVADIKTATATALQSCRFMPSPAELRELVGTLRASDRAELAWLAFQHAMQKHGPYKSIDFDDATINAVCRSLGGWIALFEVASGDWEFMRGKFLKSYEALSRAGFGDEQAAPLIGLFDQQNVQRGFDAQPPKRITTGLPPTPQRAIGAAARPVGVAVNELVPKLKGIE